MSALRRLWRWLVLGDVAETVGRNRRLARRLAERIAQCGA